MKPNNAFISLEARILEAFINKQQKTIKYPAELENVKNILLIFPTSNLSNGLFNDVGPSLWEEKLPHLNVAYMGKEMDRFENQWKNSKIIPISKDDLNLYSSPRKKLLDKIRKYEFDLSVDLNPSFELLYGLITLKCHIPLRLGFSENVGIPYYNLKLVSCRNLAINEKIKFLFDLFFNIY